MDFLASLGILLLCGLALGSICRKLKLPPLLGMMAAGMVLGPYAFNLIAPEILHISSDLRQLALIIILTRAGLSFDIQELRKNGRSAVMLCFVPAAAEIVGYVIFGVLLLRLSWNEAALLGTVMAAVSPAVVVPRMLKLKEAGYGTDKGIPQMILTGASADDIFVIILFTALLAMSGNGGSFDIHFLWKTPVSILTGIALGLLSGWLAAAFFMRFHMRDTVKIVILLSVSFFFVALEHTVGAWIPFSGLLAVLAMGATLMEKHTVCAKRLSVKYAKLWVVAEILLFVLVGATVDVRYALQSGGMILAVIALALAFRMLGVYLCVVGTTLTRRERLFCMLAYTPKATVQAAIGAVPLSMGLACGQMILTAAVIAILVTAPLGAFLTDLSYKKLLNKQQRSDQA